MFSISNHKLEFIFESFLKVCYNDLHSARLRGLFKDEYFALGKIDILEKLIHALNLNIDVDKFKF